MLILWVILCVFPAAWASSKGRSGTFFFVFSVLFSPIIGLIVVACLKKRQPAQNVIYVVRQR